MSFRTLPLARPVGTVRCLRNTISNATDTFHRVFTLWIHLIGRMPFARQCREIDAGGRLMREDLPERPPITDVKGCYPNTASVIAPACCPIPSQSTLSESCRPTEPESGETPCSSKRIRAAARDRGTADAFGGCAVHVASHAGPLGPSCKHCS